MMRFHLHPVLRSDWFHALLVVLYALACFAWYSQDALTQPYFVNDDTSQHIFWMHRWGDHHFVPDDPLVAMGELIQPWGYLALARLLSFFMGPMAFSVYMPFFALLATCLFPFFLLKKRFGFALAFGATVVLGSLLFERMAGFHARALAYPLLLGFAYFFLKKKTWATAFLLLLSALFYPIVFLVEVVVVGVLAGYEAIFYWRNERATATVLQKLKSRKQQILVVGTAVVLGLAVGWLKSQEIKSSPIAGATYPKTELLSMDEFTPEGRVSITPDMIGMASWTKNRFPNYPFGLLMFALMLGLWVYVNRRDPEHRDFDAWLVALPLAGFLLFMAARLLLFQLFLPERYLTYTYPVFFVLLLTRLAGHWTAFWNRKVPATLLVGGLLLCTWFFKPTCDSCFHDYSNDAPLFEAIDRTPRKGMIAGPPHACNQVPLFCKRSVLFSYEACHALYYKNYWAQLHGRMLDFFDAYTASDPAVLKGFIEKYGLDYLIIQRSFFEKNEEPALFRPVRREFKERLRANRLRDFAINYLPPDCFIPVDERYSLLDCQKWLDDY